MSLVSTDWTDPVSGKIYHMKFNPPEDEKTMAHLVQKSDDTEEKVHSNVATVQGSCARIAIEVDGTKKPEDVSVMITKSIDALIASRGQHDPSTRS